MKPRDPENVILWYVVTVIGVSVLGYLAYSLVVAYIAGNHK